MRSRRLIALAAFAALAPMAPAAGAHKVPRPGGVAAAIGHVREPKEVHRKLIVRGRRVVVGRHGDPIAHFKALARAMPRRSALVAAGAGSVPALPSTGCPVEQRADDTADAVSTAPQVRVVYAYAADQPDRYQTFKDYAQQDVSWAQQFVAAASNGTKTIRFDLGTPCGPQYVDLTSIRLPQTLSWYQAGGSSELAIQRIEADLRPILQMQDRDVAVYADGVAPTDGAGGIADLPDDETPGPANAAYHGGWFAVIFATATGTYRGLSFRALTLLHETTHTLGAVHDGAPHATGAGHCYDAMNLIDIMCYPDGGPNIPSPAPASACDTEVYDCNADDYFAPAPTLGSYLATHWNVYDSPFMCDAATCVPSSPPPPPNSPPSAAFAMTSDGHAVTRVPAGAGVVLDGRGSHDAEGPLSYAWDLDGDGANDATGAVLTHAFPNPGVFPIRLTVTDGDGATASATHALSVYAPDSPARPASAGAIAGRLGALLRRAKAALQRAHLHGLARGRALSVTFWAPGAGRVQLIVRAGPLTVAAGARSWKAAGPGAIALKPRRSALRRFARRRRKWFTVVATFTPSHGRAVRRTAVVAVSR